jgi:hypothetical protein
LLRLPHPAQLPNFKKHPGREGVGRPGWREGPWETQKLDRKELFLIEDVHGQEDGLLTRVGSSDEVFLGGGEFGFGVGEGFAEGGEFGLDGVVGGVVADGVAKGGEGLLDGGVGVHSRWATGTTAKASARAVLIGIGVLPIALTPLSAGAAAEATGTARATAEAEFAFELLDFFDLGLEGVPLIVGDIELLLHAVFHLLAHLRKVGGTARAAGATAGAVVDLGEGDGGKGRHEEECRERFSQHVYFLP